MTETQTLLSKYICPIPFRNSEITHDKEHMCCSEWLEQPIGSIDSVGKNWTGRTAVDIRKSILDGSYKYCSTEKCPHLNTLIKTKKPTYGLIPKEEFNVSKEFNPNGAQYLKVVFDSACNLACPSCRVDFIKNDSWIYNKSIRTLDTIKQYYGESLKELQMSGYGDPFYSTALFEFLQNFDNKWFPNLEKIHLHTNGMLWNERNWDKIKKSHPYISSAEISIDAATKETYEVVRKGGNWDLLIKNLNYINTLDQIKDLIVSFVVQKENFREMKEFYNLMTTIFKDKRNIRLQYYRILDWGVLNKDDFKEAAVWQPTHQYHSEYIQYAQELISIEDNRIIHNV